MDTFELLENNYTSDATGDNSFVANDKEKEYEQFKVEYPKFNLDFNPSTNLKIAEPKQEEKKEPETTTEKKENTETKTTQNNNAGNTTYSNVSSANPMATTTTIRTNEDKTVDAIKQRFPAMITREEWDELTKNKGYDVWREYLGFKDNPPVYDKNKEKRLRWQALGHALADGFYTLGEIIGYSQKNQPATVQLRDYKKPESLDQIEKKQELHQKELSEHNKFLKEYYKQALAYETASQKAYQDYLKQFGTETTNTVTKGGGYRIDGYIDKTYFDEMQKHKLEMARLNGYFRIYGKNKEEDDYWIPRRIADTDTFYEFYYNPKTTDKIISSAAEELFTKFLEIKDKLTPESYDRIKVATKKSHLRNRNGWQRDDNLTFLAQTVGELLYSSDLLEEEYEKAKKRGDLKLARSIFESKKKVDAILEGTKKQKFNFR